MISNSSRTGEASSLNRDAPSTDLAEARAWVLNIQKKLHQWAKNDPNKRFDDLFNLVCHPSTLSVAWAYVKSNVGDARRAWMARPDTASSVGVEAPKPC